MMRGRAYRREREQLWEVVRSGSGLGKGWGWLEEQENAKVLLGQDMGIEGVERIDRSVKSYLRKVMDKRKRWMGLGMRTRTQ